MADYFQAIPESLLSFFVYLMRSDSNPRQVVDQLFTVEMCGNLLAENSDCAFCDELFQLKEQAKKLPCHHYYHENCLLTWCNESDVCYVCDEKMYPSFELEDIGVQQNEIVQNFS